jgi:tyrosine-protein phosphatase YwqE
MALSTIYVSSVQIKSKQLEDHKAKEVNCLVHICLIYLTYPKMHSISHYTYETIYDLFLLIYRPKALDKFQRYYLFTAI